jgi:predicted  nucleic acid-binding Zn-ribbon protein
MSDETTTDDSGLSGRLTRQGEEALGKLAQDLLENPMISGAISRVFEAREKASAAQEAAMGAFNIPSAADIERLTRRLRSVSQRIEGLEDAVDRIADRLQAASGGDTGERLARIEEKLEGIASELEKLAAGSPS